MMKLRPLPLIFAAVLLTSTAAHPEGLAADPVPGGGFGEQGGQRMQQRLEQLHQELKLTSSQESAWTTWSKQMREAKQERKEARPDFETLKSMTAIERMEKMLEFVKAREASMTAVLAATKTFYPTLSADQKRTFDDLAPFGARDPKRMGRRGPGHTGRN